MVLTGEEGSIVNDGESVGDRTSQASSTDLSELASATLAQSEADDRESCLTEDEELDMPVKPALR